MTEQDVGGGRWVGFREKTGRTWAKVLFVVVLVGLGFYQGLHLADAPDSPVAYQNGRLVAIDRLSNALHDPSTRSIDGGPVAGRPFANPAGEQCRRFIDRTVSGVACQQDGDWRIVELRQVQADPDAVAGAAALPAAAAPKQIEAPPAAQGNEAAGNGQ